MIFAALVLAVPLARTYFETGLIPRVPTAILAVGLVVTGVLSCLADLILDTVTTTRHEMKRLAYLAIGPISGCNKGPQPTHFQWRETSNAAGPRVEQSQFEMKYPENAQGSARE